MHRSILSHQRVAGEQDECLAGDERDPFRVAGLIDEAWSPRISREADGEVGVAAGMLAGHRAARDGTVAGTDQDRPCRDLCEFHSSSIRRGGELVDSVPRNSC